ncbi:MAG: Holliday junction branch migration protein RuvA [Patescibacteria group bacterium]
MIYSLSGEIKAKAKNFFILENNGIGYKILTNGETLRKLGNPGTSIKCFCFLYVREDALELFGFLEEEALKLFEILNAVAGVGPKTALGILDIDTVPNILAAIIEKRADILTHASGIGQKTADRIILELQSKIKMPATGHLTKQMDIDFELEEILVNLGYQRNRSRQTIQALGKEAKTIEERLRLALKSLSRTG